MPDSKKTYASYPSLEGRAVFITGGATGIGAALVRSFAEQGAIVSFVDIDENSAKGLVDEISKTADHAPRFSKLDVTDIAKLQAKISSFASNHGALDILVNNVANDTRQGPEDLDEESWDACMKINLDAAFFAAQTAAEAMKQKGQGRIINFSSINALLGPENMTGYVTAKAALIGMTKALARDLGPDGIRVNAILPGWVVTKRQEELWLTPEAEEEWMKLVALKERIMPEDVARLCLFLASEDSSKITGQSFVIDGGRT